MSNAAIQTVSMWQGALGEKLVGITAVVARKHAYQTRSGFKGSWSTSGQWHGRKVDMTAYEFVDAAGNIFVCFTSSKLAIEPGMTITFSATVKHHTFDGGNEKTVLSRLKLSK